MTANMESTLLLLVSVIALATTKVRADIHYVDYVPDDDDYGSGKQA